LTEERISEVHEHEMYEVLTPEQKTALKKQLADAIRGVQRKPEDSPFQKAVRAVLLDLALALLAQSPHFPKAAFGATWEGLATYIERKRAESDDEDDEEDPWEELPGGPSPPGSGA